MPTSTKFQLVLSGAGSDAQAEIIARGLVDRRLAACVNIVGQTCSVYRWKGEVRREEEKLLIIKTAPHLFDEVRDAIRELHTYDVPEVLALPIQNGDADYLAWVAENLKD